MRFEASQFHHPQQAARAGASAPRASRWSRREFLRRALVLGAAGGAAPLALSLAAIGEAAAQSGDDYRALVCVFLFGGNDHYNTIVPYDQPGYDAYAAARSAPPTPIALARETLLEIVPRTSQGAGRRFALAPQLAQVKSLFDQRRAAVVANVGPIVVPTTLAQYQARSVPLPPKLFSHNDQQSVWQSLSAEGAQSGWGGRIGDLLASGNGNATFTSISAAGNAVWLSGRQVAQFQVGTGDSTAVAINAISANSLFGSSAGPAALRAIVSSEGAGLFAQDHASIVRRSIDANQLLASALGAQAPLATPFPATSLAAQLQAVARIIGARAALGARRQVFLVSLGGFDTHDNQIAAQAPLLATLDGAIAAFHAASAELGVAEQVTLFTASDFGRTLTSNGDGSDHGWGSFHFAVGGAVRGGEIYGSFPEVRIGTGTDAGQGRLLPTIAVDQYAATLALWMGVSDAELPTVLPNIGNFATRDLGMLA
ncbi:MAG: DUF1501 domain-containing protein [Burkholderiaceae bacterium]|nr:DUF1501 domain-containing protein [Burkholderiaceae bacterium]